MVVVFRHCMVRFYPMRPPSHWRTELDLFTVIVMVASKSTEDKKLSQICLVEVSNINHLQRQVPRQ